MATTITSITPIEGGITVMGNKRICIADVVLASSPTHWPEGGLSLPSSAFGMSSIDTLLFCGGSKAQYNWVAGTLQAYISTTAGSGMALATGVNVAETIRVVALGYGLA